MNLILCSCYSQTKATPSPDSEFAELYTIATYRRNVSRKLMEMKRIVRSGDVEAALRDERFRVELNRIRDLYRDHEGREDLFELVGKVWELNPHVSFGDFVSKKSKNILRPTIGGKSHLRPPSGQPWCAASKRKFHNRVRYHRVSPYTLVLKIFLHFSFLLLHW